MGERDTCKSHAHRCYHTPNTPPCGHLLHTAQSHSLNTTSLHPPPQPQHGALIETLSQHLVSQQQACDTSGTSTPEGAGTHVDGGDGGDGNESGGVGCGGHGSDKHGHVQDVKSARVITDDVIALLKEGKADDALAMVRDWWGGGGGGLIVGACVCVCVCVCSCIRCCY